MPLQSHRQDEKQAHIGPHTGSADILPDTKEILMALMELGLDNTEPKLQQE